MENPLPTLSTSSWVTDISEKADRLLSNFFVSQHSQSQMFHGHITSLTYLVQQYGHDNIALVRETKAALVTYLNSYFDEATVDATTDIPNEDDPGRTNLTIDVVVTQGGERYTLGKLIQVVNSTIAEIVSINNG